MQFPAILGIYLLAPMSRLRVGVLPVAKCATREEVVLHELEVALDTRRTIGVTHLVRSEIE